MKTLKICLIVVLSMIPCLSFAQTKQKTKFTQNIGLELCGASTGLGLRYDMRLKGNHGLGFSAAVAYSHGIDAAYEKGSDLDNILIPVEVNYLTGKNNSHFEVGLGMMNGRYSMPHWSFYGYYFYFNIGWRYQKPKGFMFRTGLSPSFGWGTHYMEKSWFFPYIGVGWSF